VTLTPDGTAPPGIPYLAVHPRTSVVPKSGTKDQGKKTRPTVV